jgi:CrcB protein
MKWLLIAFGGAAGAVLRFALTSWGQRVFGGPFPVGTVAVNTLGCLMFGFMGAMLATQWQVREEFRLAILIGFLGGFTTFSTYSAETVALVGEGDWWNAAANLLVSNVLGLLAVLAGFRLAGHLQGA